MILIDIQAYLAKNQKASLSDFPRELEFYIHYLFLRRLDSTLSGFFSVLYMECTKSGNPENYAVTYRY